jgi:hypothetical protein
MLNHTKPLRHRHGLSTAGFRFTEEPGDCKAYGLRQEQQGQEDRHKRSVSRSVPPERLVEAEDAGLGSG